MKRRKLINKEPWNTILLVIFFTLMALLLFYVLEILRVSSWDSIRKAMRRMDDRLVSRSTELSPILEAHNERRHSRIVWEKPGCRVP